MKHWDLYPDETVQLISATGVRIKAKFLSRDTITALFAVEADGQEDFLRFNLRDNGDLSERISDHEIVKAVRGDRISLATMRAGSWRERSWFILGADRNRRMTLPRAGDDV